MATILDGKATGEKIREELREKISSLKTRGVCPGLGIVQVGERKDSATYIRMKGKACKDLGIHFEHIHHSEDVSRETLVNSINKLIPYLKNDKKNNDNKINFILLKKIGKTTLPNKYKISLNNLKKISKTIAKY